MILVICVDDKGGMAFNGRRQSMDRLLRADLLQTVGERSLWVSPYTAKQFDPAPANLQTAEDFLTRAGEADTFTLVSAAEFPGSSHKTLTKEVYTK